MKRKILTNTLIADEATGLYNREGFYELSQKEIERACRENQPISLFYLYVNNIDHLMKRNSGKSAKELLKVIAKCLQSNCRNTDLMGCLEAGKFFILAPQTGAESAIVILHRLREALDAVIHEDVVANIGAVTYLTPPSSIQSMLEKIESLMHPVRNNKKISLPHLILKK